MTSRALLVGAQTAGLTGVDEDLRRMTAVLEARGFVIDTRRGPDAGRRGILDGIDALTASTTSDDAAVFYFSGHAAHGFNTDPHAGSPDHPDVPLRLQFIIPMDYDGEGRDDFRGITSWEISLFMADLAARSPNVTAIFDCCHAAQMSRDAAARQAVARALPYPQHVSLAKYLEILRQRGARLDMLHPEGHPFVVRLFACETMQSAWEYTNDAGQRGGAFTEALTDVLGEIGDTAIGWDAIGRTVRERVLQRFPDQRPDLGGPLARAPFVLHEPLRSRAVPLAMSAGRTMLRAGRMTGVVEGDIYAVMPGAVAEHDPAREVARATVTRVGALDAEVSLAPDGPVPAGALAFPIAQNLDRYPVRVDGNGSAADAMRAAVAEAPRLRPTTAGDDDILAFIRASDADVEIADGVGDLLSPRPWGGNPDQTRQLVVDFLSDLAVARSFRALEGAHDLPARCCMVEWGTVDSGKRVPQPERGALLGLGDRVYVRIDNESDRDVFVHVFNVGVRGKITRLSTSAALGVRVASGQGTTFGAVDGQGLVGFGLRWPDGLPTDSPRRDELLVVATSRPVDLGVLETEQRLTRSAVGKGADHLRQLLTQLHRGGTRDADPFTLPDGFVLVLRSFQLHPSPGRIASGGRDFLVDDNPRSTRAALATRAWRSASGAREELARGPDEKAPIAIRLTDLIVHDVKTLFGPADLRVDVMVCTPTLPGSQPYVVKTLSLPQVSDGEVPPLDNVLLFHGHVHDFVDLCLWVSVDRGRPSLLELIAAESEKPEVKEAMAALATAADVPGWIGAVGASAVIARVAYRALAAAASPSIGLYRTSFLASERFGVGRHPATGLRRAQDFSFALDISHNAPPPR
jgi:hypothetical protein